MNLRRIKHALFRLSNEEKMVGAGSLLVLISTFMPWYSVVFNFNEEGVTQSGFSGDLGVIGFITFLLTGMALATLVAENINFKLPNFGHKKEQIILFLMGESAFLLLLTLAVYTKRSFDYTNASIRFGLLTALLGAVMGSFAIYAQSQKKEKKTVEAFFAHEDETIAQETVTDINNDHETEELLEEKSTETIANEGKYFYEAAAETIEAEKPEQASLIPEETATAEEVKTIEDAISEEAKEEVIAEPAKEETIEDAMNFEIQDEPTETIQAKPESQGDFFTREAGVQSPQSGIPSAGPTSQIKVDMDTVQRIDEQTEEAQNTETAKETNESSEEKEQVSDSGFYEDM